MHDYQEKVPPELDDIIKPNDNGGGGNMNKYVTHEELSHVAEKLTDKMDLMDSKDELRVEKVKSSLIIWYISTTIALAGLLLTVLGLMISHIK
ncbi:hypothetical protein [Pediococcus argentinicus]|uniref:Uncharacterized protein n=1 Tax=Pediococcus argentinicus TaxID=480391 RepID=A0A0R2NR74_9LACO|nr:hypothetical protein [Pediococcus argentinicus]KRO25658.1 hypothetical protein IV88_GL001616 [Pediococcus argentinicus]